MKLTAQQFRDLPNKSITLLGMSGVGKTTLSSLLPSRDWFHYSGDYRIGTKYLSEPMMDSVKAKAMEHPYLRELLCRDHIYIRPNITIDHLDPISHFLGKLGCQEKGGLDVTEFKRRQSLFREAEVHAMQDVDEFMDKSRRIYGYPHFVNDAGGSICCLSDEECWHGLSQSTVILYLHADPQMEKTLVERAVRRPKPLFYDNEFLDLKVAEYLETHDLPDTEHIVPDEFMQWMLPALIDYRRPMYERIAEQYGYVIEAEKIFDLESAEQLIELVCESIAARE